MKSIAVVGATGLVGSCFLDLMREKNISPDELYLFASKKNEGQKIHLAGKEYEVQTLKPGCFKNIQTAFFSAGGEAAREWAPQAMREGCVVIDNSSAFRLKENIPLVVPEINFSDIGPEDRLISNPNCSTIQMVLALHPLQQAFGIESVYAATYQSMSGAGAGPLKELKNQTRAFLQNENKKNREGLAFNCTPFIGAIGADGFCGEETKMQEETKKILHEPSLKVSVFTVRVPVLFSHGEAVWVRFKKKPQNKEEVISILKKGEGLSIVEDPPQAPTPHRAEGQDAVFVGRIHQAKEDPHLWLMWIAADNLRKGAALNGLQIALRLGERF